MNYLSPFAIQLPSKKNDPYGVYYKNLLAYIKTLQGINVMGIDTPLAGEFESANNAGASDIILILNEPTANAMAIAVTTDYALDVHATPILDLILDREEIMFRLEQLNKERLAEVLFGYASDIASNGEYRAIKALAAVAPKLFNGYSKTVTKISATRWTPAYYVS